LMVSRRSSAGVGVLLTMMASGVVVKPHNPLLNGVSGKWRG